MRMKWNITPGRTAIVLSGFMIAVLCCSKISSGNKHSKKGNRITYDGNIFELTFVPADTTWTTDPATGDKKIVATGKHGYDTVVKMNNEPVYYVSDKHKLLGMRIAEYRLKEVISEVLLRNASLIPKGRYSYYYTNVIIDNEGKVVFYEEEGGLTEYAFIYNDGQPLRFEGMIPDNAKKELDQKIEKAIKGVELASLIINGKPTAYNITVGDDFTIR